MRYIQQNYLFSKQLFSETGSIISGYAKHLRHLVYTYKYVYALQKIEIT